MNEDKILELVGIKTPTKYYLATKESLSSSYGKSDLSHYLWDGIKAKKTFKRDWYVLDTKPLKATRNISGKRVNKRYELTDPTLACEKIPLVLTTDQVKELEDCNYNTYWEGEFSSLEGLYEPKWDRTPDSIEDVPFNLECILELEEELKSTEFNFKGQPNNQIIDKIMFPSLFVECNRPVKLSSEDLYKTIREHIQNNIDPVNALITSNYDFCFTVKKRVHLNSCKEVKTEIKKNNGRSYSTPKWRTNIKKYEGEYVMFEMTDKRNNYRDYTPLQDLVANNVEDLNRKVKYLLDELMKQINSRVEVCPTCLGKGYLEEEASKVNINSLLAGYEEE